MSRLSNTKHPDYHLRPNKSIDRFIFLELLRTLELKYSLKNHTYIGMGGPFIEDFKLLSQYFPLMDLICLEEDGETHKRQKFHKCSRKMKCLHYSLREYIATKFPTHKMVIIWADYTDMSRECLVEVSDIARKSVPGSVLRVTVRAETPIFNRLKISSFKYPPNVPEKKKLEFEKLQNYYKNDLSVDGIAYRSNWFQWENFSREHFPQTISRMFKMVIEGACTSPKVFLPLHSMKYSDGTIMLSITGLICLKQDAESLQNHFRNHFIYHTKYIDELDEVDIPTLTFKERLHLDRILPSSNLKGVECNKRLGYLIEGDESETLSKRKMQDYEKYYRLYPYFGKVVP